VYGTRAEIQRRIDQTASREALVDALRGKLSGQDVIRLEEDGLAAGWKMGKPRP